MWNGIFSHFSAISLFYLSVTYTQSFFPVVFLETPALSRYANVARSGETEREQCPHYTWSSGTRRVFRLSIAFHIHSVIPVSSFILNFLNNYLNIFNKYCWLAGWLSGYLVSWVGSHWYEIWALRLQGTVSVVCVYIE